LARGGIRQTTLFSSPDQRRASLAYYFAVARVAAKQPNSGGLPDRHLKKISGSIETFDHYRGLIQWAKVCLLAVASRLSDGAGRKRSVHAHDRHLLSRPEQTGICVILPFVHDDTHRDVTDLLIMTYINSSISAAEQNLR